MVASRSKSRLFPVPLLGRGSFAEPFSFCIRSFRTVKASLGYTILVSGSGTMCLLHVKAALAMGVRVIVCDITPSRLDDARRMGADEVLDASDGDS